MKPNAKLYRRLQYMSPRSNEPVFQTTHLGAGGGPFSVRRVEKYVVVTITPRLQRYHHQPLIKPPLQYAVVGLNHARRHANIPLITHDKKAAKRLAKLLNLAIKNSVR